MKEARLVLDGSVCQGDFKEGIDTIAELRQAEREDCRFLSGDCPVLKREGPYCIAKAGQEVARFTVKLHTTLQHELSDFKREAPMPANGYFDPIIEEPVAATRDRDEVVRRVGGWAEKVLGIQAIDASSHNREYTSQTGEKTHNILEESVFDEDTGNWVHACGSRLSVTTVYHPVHLRVMPLAGFGEVRQEEMPYCGSCNEAHDPQGAPWYAEDLGAAEHDHLKKLRDS